MTKYGLLYEGTEYEKPETWLFYNAISTPD
jgi:hypothetical protein